MGLGLTLCSGKWCGMWSVRHVSNPGKRSWREWWYDCSLRPVDSLSNARREFVILGHIIHKKSFRRFRAIKGFGFSGALQVLSVAAMDALLCGPDIFSRSGFCCSIKHLNMPHGKRVKNRLESWRTVPGIINVENTWLGHNGSWHFDFILHFISFQPESICSCSVLYQGYRGFIVWSRRETCDNVRSHVRSTAFQPNCGAFNIPLVRSGNLFLSTCLAWCTADILGACRHLTAPIDDLQLLTLVCTVCAHWCVCVCVCVCLCVCLSLSLCMEHAFPRNVIYFYGGEMGEKESLWDRKTVYNFDILNGIQT